MTRERLIEKLQTVRRTFESIRDEAGNDDARDRRARFAQADFARACILAAGESPPLLPLSIRTVPKVVTPEHWAAICLAMETLDPAMMKVEEVRATGPDVPLNTWLDHAIDVTGAVLALARDGVGAGAESPQSHWWGPTEAAKVTGVNKGTIDREAKRPGCPFRRGWEDPARLRGLKVEPESLKKWAKGRGNGKPALTVSAEPSRNGRALIPERQEYQCRKCGHRQQEPGECDSCPGRVEYLPKKSRR